MASSSSAKLLLEIVGDSTSAVSAVKKTTQATGEAQGSAKKATSSLGNIAKGVATGFAVAKVVDFGKKVVAAAYDSQKSHDRLVAVFKGVGDAQGAAAAAAENYAGKLSAQTGIDDELIMNGQAILATFHSVSGATGRTAGIFDRATAAGADLAAAGFGSIESNAVQLGKALEDPKKGLTALAKSGVTFTQAQKDQIEQMTAGKASAKELADAQLKVATAQKTYNDQVKKHGAASLQARDAQRKLANAQEDQQKVQSQGSDLLGAQKIVLKGVEDQVKGTAAATGTSAEKMNVAWGNAQEAIGTTLLPAIEKISSMLAGLFGFVSANASWLVPMAGAIIGIAGGMIAVAKAVEIVKGAIAGVKLVWMGLNAVFAMSPLGLIIIGIVALVAAFVILYLKVDWFRKAVDTALRAIVGFFKAAWSGIQSAFTALVGFIQRWGQLFLAVLLGPWYLVFKLIKAAITGGWSGVMAQIGQWVGMLGRAVSAIGRVISAPFVAAWGAIYRGLVVPVSNMFSGVVGAISRALAGVTAAITAPFKAAWDWINAHVLAPIKGAWNGVARVINSVHVSLRVPKNIVTDKLGIGGKGFDLDPPNVPMLAAGGFMTRTGLIYAHAGEVISPAPASVRSSGAPTPLEVHLHVNVPPTANPAETGRAVAGALRAYFSAGGRLAVPAVPGAA